MSGTWTSHCKNKENGFMKVSDKLEIIAAATLRTNPATGKSQVFSSFLYTIFCKLSICVPSAYRMLKDFVGLDEGDVVIFLLINHIYFGEIK